MDASSSDFLKASDVELRTYVAAMALQGVISAYSGEGVKLPGEEYAAKVAVEYADALLNRLRATS